MFYILIVFVGMVRCAQDDENASLAVHVDYEPESCKDPSSAKKILRGDDLSIHYTGTIDKSSQTGVKGRKFDSSYDRNSPFQFRIGQGQVIRGWDEGLLGLCEGSKATLVIPPELGNGEGGAGGGVIPGGATLRFTVEVVSVSGQSHQKVEPVPSREEVIAKEAEAKEADENEKEAEMVATKDVNDAVQKKAAAREATVAEDAAAKEKVAEEAAEVAAQAEREAEVAREEAKKKDQAAREAEVEAGVEAEVEGTQPATALGKQAATEQSPWKVGDKVSAQWKRLSKLYPASIARVNQDGSSFTFDIKYDDGAQEKKVDSKYVHKLRAGAAGDDGGEHNRRISVPNENKSTSINATASSDLQSEDSSDNDCFVAPYDCGEGDGGKHTPASKSTSKSKHWTERMNPLNTIPKMGERKYRPKIGQHWHIISLLALVAVGCSVSIGILYATTDESPAQLFRRFRALIVAGKRTVARGMNDMKEQAGISAGGPGSGSGSADEVEWSGMEMQDTVEERSNSWSVAQYVSVAGEYGDDTAYTPVIDTTSL